MFLIVTDYASNHFLGTDTQVPFCRLAQDSIAMQLDLTDIAYQVS